MSTAAALIVEALSRADRRDAQSCTTVMSCLLATSQLRSALAPHISAARFLTGKMFKVVAAVPTVWCAAHLRLDSPSTAVLQQTPAAFVQLRSIRVRGEVAKADMPALTAMPALLNQRTLREIEFGREIAVTDAMLRGFSTVTARLETLIIDDGAAVTDAGLASLRNTPMIATLRKFSLAASFGITDAGVAAFLGPMSELRSLTVERCARLSGAFLAQLHEHCHDSLAEIDLSQCNSIDNAGAVALCNFRSLTELGLSSGEQLSLLPLERLPLLRAVKGWFLCGCSGLMTLDMSALTRLTRVEDYFLSGCDGLTTLDLAGCANVTHVGGYFLSNCTGIKTLDLSALKNVTTVGACFLLCCSGLKTLDLAALSNITVVSDHFLCGCSGLGTLDLSALTNVESVGSSFLRECSGLTMLDLAGLNNLKSVGDSFLARCSSLTTLDLAALAGVTSVDDHFLSGHSRQIHAPLLSLKSLDLSAMSAVTRVGANFLLGHSNLKTLRLSVALLQHDAVLDEHKQLHARSSAAAARAGGR